MGFISDVIVSHESNLGGYESHLGCYEFLEVWCWLKMGLDQTGPIREGLGASHVTVGRHVRDITDHEELIRIVPNQKADQNRNQSDYPETQQSFWQQSDTEL